MTNLLDQVRGRTVEGWELGIGFVVLYFADGLFLRVQAEANEAGNPDVPDVRVTVYQEPDEGIHVTAGSLPPLPVREVQALLADLKREGGSTA